MTPRATRERRPARGARHAGLIGWVLLATLGVPAGSSAQETLTVEYVAWVEQVVAITSAPGDASRLFAVERAGRIRVIANGQVRPEAFLDLSLIVASSGGEQGLLGLAFDPDYQDSGHFYVAYTGPAPSPDTQLVRFRVSPNPEIADPGSAQTVLSIERQWNYHNGGWLGFGPADGLLYFAAGDGGGECDPNQSAQDPDSLLGKILRIDVSTLPYTIPPGNPYAQGGGRPEIIVAGLRNPWRCGIDAQTGDLWIGDVGEGAAEEIDIVPGALLAAPQAAPVNFGWDCREGFACASFGPSPCPVSHCPAGCASPAFVDPVHAYSHANGCAVTGGYVYRGCAMPALRGTYFFGDFCSGRSWSFRYDAGVITQFTERTAQLDPPGGPPINNIPTFGEDGQGELYVTNYGGAIYRIIPAVPPPDCNENGRPDGCDIALGFSPDINANGIPDECEQLCYPDCTGEGTLTVADFGCFQSKYVLGNPYADCNASGGLTVADFGCFQGKYVLGCP